MMHSSLDKQGHPGLAKLNMLKGITVVINLLGHQYVLLSSICMADKRRSKYVLKMIHVPKEKRNLPGKIFLV